MINKTTGHRAVCGIVLFCFAFVFVTGLIFVPRQVQAQAVVESGPLTATIVQKEVRLGWGNALLASALVGIVNAIQLFAQQAAYDLAVGLSTGCRGENACAWKDDFGTWFTKNTYDAAGEFLASLEEFGLAKLGLSICNPRIPDIGLAISLGLIGEVQRPKPRCQFQQVLANWESVVREVRDPHALLSHVSMSFSPGQSDMGQALRAHEAFRLKIEREKQATILDRLEGGGIKAQVSSVSGNKTTPAAVIGENFKQLAHQGENDVISTGDVVSAAIDDGAIWAAVGTSFISTFANTLVSRMLQMALQGIFGAGTAYEIPDLREQFATGEFGVDRGAGVEASALAAGLLSTQIRTSSGAYDFLTEMAACPSQEGHRSQFNCVIDDQFMLGIQRAIAGSAITVQEAVDGPYLDASRPFGYIDPTSDPPREPNRNEGYAYSSMKKLRLLRIIPVGWEFAAERIIERGIPATLGDVLDGWRDSTSPFYGLVDPNWLLKAPVAQCAARTWGAMIDASGTGRREACADVRHCIAEDELGNCSAWGYCTRERNIWRFNGDECDAQYASCETFTRRGVSGTPQQRSLLENTVDFGACNAENAGCQVYNTGDPDAPHLYLDRDVQACEGNVKGCTEFISAPGLEIPTEEGSSYGSGLARKHYQIPPDHLGCTGEITDSSECAEYARYCREEEVGCEEYTPDNGDPSIPGIATALDRCDEDCVGYDTYLKLGSRFEPQFNNNVLENELTDAEFVTLWPAATPQEDLYPLIPRNSLSCHALDAGCDEFTNLRTEQRQYYSDLRACQLPGPTSQTYFTWEGSESAGYQLRTWSFKQSNRSYTDDSAALGIKYASGTARPPCTNYAVQVEANGNIRVDCEDDDTNQAVCDPAESFNCRSFYDEDGNIFHRSMPSTIVSTEECQSFRWTGFPRLPEIAAQAGEGPDVLRRRLEEVSCRASDGYWDDGVNQCLYLGAPSLSQGCSAQISGCRGFKGNTGSNIQTLFEDQFISPAEVVDNWGPSARVSFSNESLRANEHSIKADRLGPGTAIGRSLRSPNTPTPQLTPGAAYFLRFNAKGTAGQTLHVSLRNQSAIDEFPGVVPLSTEWQHFEMGPLIQTNIDQSALQQCAFDTASDIGRPCEVDDVQRCIVPANRTSCTYFETPELVFENSSSSVVTFYADDIALRKSQDTIYLVKHSSQVPIACDTQSDAAGGGYLRGAMLGCRTYIDRADEPHHLKSFSSLCRVESVGCDELIDTRNFDSPLAQNFNIENNGICRGFAGACSIDTDNDGVLDTEVCTIVDGQNSCSYGPRIDGTTSNLPVDDWSVPPDLIRYVVTSPEFACQQEQSGCQALTPADGQEVTLINDPDQYSEIMCRFEEQGCSIWQRQDQSIAYFKDPGDAACRWRTNVSIGDQRYYGWFRDVNQPVDDPGDLVDTEDTCAGYGSWNSSARLCVDDEGVTVALPGAFSACNACGSGTDPSCTECAELCNSGAGGVWNAGRCESDAPCYGVVGVDDDIPNAPKISVDILHTYLIGGATFGIYRNADPLYQGRTGDCPADQATCTEFVDPTDQTERSDGKSYYFKDNERLDAARKKCDQKISRKQGCILFDRPENPAKYWNAEESYTASERSDYHGESSMIDPEPVDGATCVGGLHDGKHCLPPTATGSAAAGEISQSACIDNGGACRLNNNTNTILKVKRDRECAEWFQCASAQWVWDQGEFKAICTSISRCDQLNPTTQKTPGGSLIQCARWNPRPSLARVLNASEASCVDSNLSWDEDHCEISRGWCIGNNFEGVWRSGRCELGVLTAGTYLLRDRRYQGQEYTGYSVPNIYALDQLEEVNLQSFVNPDYYLGHVSDDTCEDDDDCFIDQECTLQGRCAEGLVKFSAPASDQCRGYPERDAPFPNTDVIRNNQAFGNIGRCMRTVDAFGRNDLICDCDYTKAEYGAEKVYYGPRSSEPADAYCIGVNDSQGRPRSCGEGETLSREACQEQGGFCQNQTAEYQAVGFRGYCLEEDTDARLRINADRDQRPCLTWLPVDRLAGAADIYNQFPEAGYRLPDAGGGRYYCLFANAPAEEGIELFNQHVESPDGYNGAVRIITNDIEGFGILKHDIKKIEILITEGQDDIGVPSYRGGRRAAVINLFPNQSEITAQYHARNSQWNDYWDAKDATIGNDWWWWASDDNANEGSSREGEGSAPLPLRLGRALTRTESVPLVDGFVDVGCEGWVDVSEDDYVGNGDTDESYDGFGVALRFDEDDGKLTHIRVAACSADNTPAGDWNAHIIDNVQVTIFPHPYCTYIAGIDTGLGSPDSAPRTNVLWPGSNYTIEHEVEVCRLQPDKVCRDSIPNDYRLPPGMSIVSNRDCHSGCVSPRGGRPRTDYLTDPAGVDIRDLPADDYVYDTLHSPFGSSPSRSAPPTSSNSHPWFLNHNLLETEDSPSFAGWPYGCEVPHTPWASGFPSVDYECSVRLRSLGEDLHLPIHVGASEDTAVGPTTLPNATEHFKQLFAKSDNLYSWNTAGTSMLRSNYDTIAPNPASPPPHWDVRGGGSAPIVHAVGPGSGGLEEIPGEAVNSSSGLTIGDEYLPGSMVIGTDGSLNVALKFFAYADENQMPIRSIAIAWGDGRGIPGGEGMYKNMRGAGQCPLNSFGGIVGQTCEPNYYQYTTVYTCDQESENWHVGRDCPVDEFAELHNGCCVFRPAVQVIDNWGWCSSMTLPPWDPADPLAYQQDCSNSYDSAIPFIGGDPAQFEHQPGWISSQGVVVIAPRLED